MTHKTCRTRRLRVLGPVACGLLALPAWAGDLTGCDPDIDGDGTVLPADLCLWHQAPCDVDGNGTTDLSDAWIIVNLIQVPFDDCNENAIPDECEGLQEVTDLAAGEGSLISAVALEGELLLVGDHLVGAGVVRVHRRALGDWDATGSLHSPDGSNGDFFGRSVALDDGLAVIGANLHDAQGSNSGAAYVFDLVGIGGGGGGAAKLLAPGGAPGDHFGKSVAISGGRIAVGAPRSDVGAADMGAVYVFAFDGLGWVHEQTLTPADGAAGDRYGFEIDLDGDALLVGAPEHDGHAGAAYLYRHDGGAFVLEQKLDPLGLDAGDGYGRSVALHGDVAVVGAPYSGGPLASAGTVFVWRHAVAWALESVVSAPDAADGAEFGNALDVEGDLLAVGAWLSQQDSADSGATYLFRRSGGGWIDAGTLTVGDAPEGDWLGADVAVSGGLVAASASGGAALDVYLWAFMGTPDDDGDGSPDDCLAVFCPADFDQNGSVDFSDMLAVLGFWGPCPEGISCPGDADQDGEVDFADLILVLEAWGPCGDV